MAGRSRTKDRSDYLSTGEKIKYWRRKRGWTQEQLAERIGDDCNAKQVSYWESGNHEIGIGTFFILSEILGVSPNDLAPERLSVSGGDEDANPLYSKLNEQDRNHVDFMIERLYKAEQAGA